MVVACSSGAGGVILRGGGVLERQCPDAEVQHIRKWCTLMWRSEGPYSGVDVPT